MTSPRLKPGKRSFCILFLIFSTCLQTFAQQRTDTSGKVQIEILPGNGTVLQYIQTDSGGVNKLIGNVALKQGETLLYCDSAYIDLAKNNVQAFGNVNIIQPGGTQVQSDYLRYTGNTKDAYLLGNASLTDGKNNLWTEELEYNLGTKIGVYTKGGTLQSESTTLSSNAGTYNVKTKDARFTGEVIVSDPQYDVTSDDLGYNTERKLVTFYGPSVVKNDKSELRTSRGTWDAKNEVAHFPVRSSIQSDGQNIEADKMDYNRKTGYGVATGNVVALDTSRHTTLYSGYARYNERSRKLLAAIKPVIKQVHTNDSLYLRADTFFSEPVRVRRDTAGFAGRRALDMDDTLDADSNAPRYFIGYHHVLVYSDSLQAQCDSISYSQADSTMRLMFDPIAWSRNSQITGDTILLYLDSNKLKRIFVPDKALIVSRSGPEKAQMFDQIQGKTLTGFFEDNNIKRMIVWPSAQSIYYSKDEQGAYLGVNQAQSERMKVFFDNKEISRILLEQEVKQTMTPMKQANISALHLSRFRWLAEKRPKGVEELFLYDPLGSDAATVPEAPEKENAPPAEKKGKKKKRSRK